jgi:hypothetical protein
MRPMVEILPGFTTAKYAQEHVLNLVDYVLDTKGNCIAHNVELLCGYGLLDLLDSLRFREVFTEPAVESVLDELRSALSDGRIQQQDLG